MWTVSAPKSVSFVFGLAGPHVAEQVRAAHAAAVEEAWSYLHSQASKALRGHHGDGQSAARVGTDGPIVAAFDHLTSRAGDPQLHTHLVIPNLVHGADGRWSAMDTRALCWNPAGEWIWSSDSCKRRSSARRCSRTRRHCSLHAAVAWWIARSGPPPGRTSFAVCCCAASAHGRCKATGSTTGGPLPMQVSQ